ncbi:MATE family efflux transporter [Olsenella sp. HMSC062G07]|uniref:MATE family efflux transporter n=1 Tax=Olsenella sp. HMSC062G07 TaxID=1739330 RepID=UPI0008D5EC63|nr:MATE family efflux transporter [Olsenella sp. HMSC062G07]OFK24921.1 MATE family efflux transporter [Olsenella sp. HMSC062G07]
MGGVGVAEGGADEKFRQMTEGPVGPLVMSLALPSIVSNLVTTIYNLADAYFIGRISTAAEGAIGVAFVTMTLIQAIGFFFGQGAGNAMSRYLGSRDEDAAATMAVTGLVLSFFCGFVLAVVGHAFLEPLCRLAGSTDTILPFARTYVSLILVGAPWMAASLTLNMQLRFMGEARYAMVALVSGALLNVALAPALIFGAGLGIAGAGLATIICQLVSFFLLVAGLQACGLVRLSRRAFGVTGGVFAEMANGGFPSMARQVVAGIATTLLNSAARPFGDAALAAIAIVGRIVSFGNYVQIGIGQGYQPVCGYNYGARNYERMREGFGVAVRMSLAAVALISVVTFALAPQLVALLRDDPDVIRIATLTLRLQSVTLPLTGVAMIINFSLQTTGRMWRATLVGLARMGIVLGPVVVLLSSTLGLLGVQLSQSVADLMSIAIAIPFGAALFRELEGEGERGAGHDELPDGQDGG